MPPENGHRFKAGRKQEDRTDIYILDQEDPTRVARAISTCLRYLCQDARKIGLNFTAHLIAVANLSITHGRLKSTDRDEKKQ